MTMKRKLNLSQTEFLPLIKMKRQNIKVIGDKKSVLKLKSKSKLVKL